MSLLRTVKASELLVWLRRNDVRLGGLPPDLSPLDLEEAYEIQAAVARLRGMQTRAFTIGMTSSSAQKTAGLKGPVCGRLSLPDILRSPALIEVRPSHMRVIEPQVILEIGHDLPAGGAPVTREQMLDCVRGAYPGIVVCNSRFQSWADVTLGELVADNVNAERIIVGEALSDMDRERLDQLPVTVKLPGVAPIQGSTARVLGGPLTSAIWLANWLKSRGEGLKRGQMIATGGCTEPVEIGPTAAAIALFGTDATVAVEFGHQISS
jgi:2-keto-4-pentenoate hydratase